LNTPPFLVGSASANHCSGVFGIAAIVVERIEIVDNPLYPDPHR
jgi:hypothetical protein